MLLGYGVDLTVAEIARRLVTAHGHSVDVWTPTSDATYAREPFAIRKLYVYGGEWNRALPVLELNAWRALRRLRAELRGGGGADAARGGAGKAGVGYDVVVPCTHPYYGAGAALGVPSVFFNFGNVPLTGLPLKGRLNRRWLDLSDRYWLPRSVACVHISRFLAEQQVRVRQRLSRVIHLGGDHYPTPPVEARARFRAELGLSAGDVALGFCGRLHRDHPPYKGTQALLELGRRLRAQEPRARLIMCGAGSGADADWVRASGAVPLLNLPPERMGEFYSALDVYVCASRWEGFNLPLVEAAWYAVPGIAYECGAHGEHVTQVLVPDGAADALAAAALELVRDESKRRALGEAAFAKAQEFSWDIAAARFNEVLTEALR
jgi:glycosyltransferase involved in cell wall biosynthesis